MQDPLFHTLSAFEHALIRCCHATYFIFTDIFDISFTSLMRHYYAISRLPRYA